MGLGVGTTDGAELGEVVGKRVGCEDSGVGSKVVGNLDGLGDG